MNSSAPKAIVIGTSAGGVNALSKILPVLPAGYAVPIMVVIHVPPDKQSIMSNLFREKCSLPVKEVEDKEDIVDGTIYFAAPDYHMLIEPTNRLSLSADERVFHSRPSIDVLFESAVECFCESLIGVILTGANEDGAHGLSEIERSGGVAIVQTPSEAEHQEMPRAAMKACKNARVMTLDKIAEYLVEVGMRK